MRGKIKKPLGIWGDSIIEIRPIVEKEGVNKYGYVDNFGGYYDEITQSYRSISRKDIGYF